MLYLLAVLALKVLNNDNELCLPHYTGSLVGLERYLVGKPCSIFPGCWIVIWHLCVLAMGICPKLSQDS